MNATDLKVGGLTRLSTCDWPGQLAATVFCQGCAWDCPYCHNPGLRPAYAETQIAWPDVLQFLRARRGLLDAVVFSGGEPTLQPALLDAVEAVRALGFRIGLHTTGMNPEAFARLLPLLDWVGFDVKAPFANYPRITGVKQSGELALRSLGYLLASCVSYEVRTTVHPSLLTAADLLLLKEQLLDLGVRWFTIQRFRSLGVHPDRMPISPADFSLPSDLGRGFQVFQVR